MMEYAMQGLCVIERKAKYDPAKSDAFDFDGCESDSAMSKYK